LTHSDKSSDLVLVNALYFKGDWDCKFNPKDTLKQDFYVGKGRTVEVDMMHNISKYAIFSLMGLDAKAIEIPYRGKKMSMIIVLPNQKDGLVKLETDLENFDTATGFNFEREVQVEVAIPKFKIESMHDLNEPLKKFGLQRIFASGGNFSGLTRYKDIFISNVIQKVFIEVKEEVAETGIPTLPSMASCSFPSIERPKFICDHPFLFGIKENLTGIVIFSGKVIQPHFADTEY